MHSNLEPRRQNSTGLVDVLDRVLDKGLVVAGDIKVSVAEVELLTIRIRLVICSIDKAQEIGLDWWRRDPYLAGRLDKLVDDGAPDPSGVERLLEENRQLREELLALRGGTERAAASTSVARATPAKSSTTAGRTTKSKSALKSPPKTKTVPKSSANERRKRAATD